jgi:hypothetical protein
VSDSQLTFNSNFIQHKFPLFLYISNLYRRLVLKAGFVVGLIIVMGVMLVIPSPISHVAKASTCSVSDSIHGNAVTSTSSSTSGACSGATSIRQGTGITGILFSNANGQKSSCTSASAASHDSVHGDISEGSGAVSCRSHSP